MRKWVSVCVRARERVYVCVREVSPAPLPPSPYPPSYLHKVGQDPVHHLGRGRVRLVAPGPQQRRRLLAVHQLWRTHKPTMNVINYPGFVCLCVYCVVLCYDVSCFEGECPDSHRFGGLEQDGVLVQQGAQALLGVEGR